MNQVKDVIRSEKLNADNHLNGRDVDGAGHGDNGKSSSCANGAVRGRTVSITPTALGSIVSEGSISDLAWCGGAKVNRHPHFRKNFCGSSLMAWEMIWSIK